ncbi:3-phenylpropionate-dihydrodiol/cinnamic acid-dihydrodiol dehydrogenase [compost metagenome]
MPGTHWRKDKCGGSAEKRMTLGVRMKHESLESRVIVITGASGGLGRALAHALHRQGARLALLDIDQGAVDGVASVLGERADVRGWAADVRLLDNLLQVMAEVRQHFGRIDVVIANAGIDALAPASTIDPSLYERIIDVNLNGVWRTFRAALPYVRETQGYLLAMSSMAAFVHLPLQAAYSASKAGVWALCDSMRLELKHHGVGIGSAHPAAFPTPMTAAQTQSAGGKAMKADTNQGVWKMLSIDAVVARLVDGIGCREELIVIPGRNGLVAKAPGLFRGFIERFVFNRQHIRLAVDQAEASGDQQHAVSRARPA